MNNETQTPKNNIIRNILMVVTGVFAGFGLLFLVLMLIPTPEEPPEREHMASEQENREKESDEQESQDESGSTEAEDASADREQASADEASAVESAAEDIVPVSVGKEARSVTVMVYMNGTDLETQSGEASTDIGEMLSSGTGDNVNVVIQTMGTKKWQDFGISSKTAQTYLVKDGNLNLIRDNLGQLDCTSPETLSEFVGFCKEEYPADRYLFVFWDHGGGPVYGFGYDEWQSEEDSLTIAEMSKAFSEHNDIHFDIIGMDCCIMANVETCYALAPYCKYALLSEDFESGLGWSYTKWMNKLEEEPGMATPLLGKYIIDSIIEDNETQKYGDSSCMALFNESTIKSLMESWIAYAYRNEDKLLGKNYSRVHKSKGRSNLANDAVEVVKGYWDSWDSDMSDVTMSDYCVSDVLALVESIDNSSDEAKSLMSALKACVAYYGHTSDKNELTGIAVSLPYGDSYLYSRLKEVYSDLGLDSDYITWLKQFVSTGGSSSYYDFGSFESSWGGWGEYEESYGCSNGTCSNSWFYSDNGSYSQDFCDSGTCDYYDYNDSASYDDWMYDYEEGLWYLYEDDVVYLYDDESDEMYYYDENEDAVYGYDESSDEWYFIE